MSDKYIEVFVHGTPQPQGAMKSIPFHKKDGKLGVSTFHQNEKLEPWRDRIEREIREVLKTEDITFNQDDPIEISMIFFFMIPASKNKKKKGYPAHHTTRPDIDKLCRAVLDAVSFASGVDDARVGYMDARKHYTHIPDSVGVIIIIQQRPSHIYTPEEQKYLTEKFNTYDRGRK